MFVLSVIFILIVGQWDGPGLTQCVYSDCIDFAIQYIVLIALIDWFFFSEENHPYCHCHFLLSDGPTMPIVDKLKEALKPGRKEAGDEGDLNKLLASSAKKVLLQKIEFEPASKGFSYQLDSLKNKYVILNPRSEGASCLRPAEPAQIKRQGLYSIRL